jgi:hypothetical protein
MGRREGETVTSFITQPVGLEGETRDARTAQYVDPLPHESHVRHIVVRT